VRTVVSDVGWMTVSGYVGHGKIGDTLVRRFFGLEQGMRKNGCIVPILVAGGKMNMTSSNTTKYIRNYC